MLAGPLRTYVAGVAENTRSWRLLTDSASGPTTPSRLLYLSATLSVLDPRHGKSEIRLGVVEGVE
jgi:hypothetical protein